MQANRKGELEKEREVCRILDGSAKHGLVAHGLAVLRNMIGRYKKSKLIISKV